MPQAWDYLHREDWRLKESVSKPLSESKQRHACDQFSNVNRYKMKGRRDDALAFSLEVDFRIMNIKG